MTFSREGCQCCKRMISLVAARSTPRSDVRKLFLHCRQLGLGNGGEAVSVDKGHCHITVPKMEMVVSLDTIGQDTRTLLQRVRGRLQDKVFCVDMLHVFKWRWSELFSMSCIHDKKAVRLFVYVAWQ